MAKIPPSTAQPSMPVKVHYSQIEAGRYLEISPRTLEKFRTIGGGPAFLKLGRRIVYLLADLDAWRDSRRCESTSDPTYLALRRRSRHGK